MQLDTEHLVGARSQSYQARFISFGVIVASLIVFILVLNASGSFGQCLELSPTLRGTFLIDNLTLSIKELGIVSGAGGDDLIVGGPLADTICGNAGHDRIYGNAGDDRISGGDGADYLEGDQGNDRCMAIVETMDSQDGKVMIIWMGARETTY